MMQPWWNLQIEQLQEKNDELRTALKNLLPPDLEWKESGLGRIRIDVSKSDLRAARKLIGYEQSPRPTEE